MYFYHVSLYLLFSTFIYHSIESRIPTLLKWHTVFTIQTPVPIAVAPDVYDHSLFWIGFARVCLSLSLCDVPLGQTATVCRHGRLAVAAVSVPLICPHQFVPLILSLWFAALILSHLINFKLSLLTCKWPSLFQAVPVLTRSCWGIGYLIWDWSSWWCEVQTQ